MIYESEIAMCARSKSRVFIEMSFHNPHKKMSGVTEHSAMDLGKCYLNLKMSPRMVRFTANQPFTEAYSLLEE